MSTKPEVKIRCKATETAKVAAEAIVGEIFLANPDLFPDEVEAVLYVAKTTKYPEGTVKIRFQETERRWFPLTIPGIDGRREEKEIKPMKHIVWKDSFDEIFGHGKPSGPATEVWLKEEKEEGK